jgi:hypothetical protein
MITKNSTQVRTATSGSNHNNLEGFLNNIRNREEGNQKQVWAAEVDPSTSSNHNQSFREIMPWLERTGWNKTFRGKDKNLLLSLTTKPHTHYTRLGLDLGPNGLQSTPQDEAKLVILADIVDIMLDHCTISV